MLIKGFYIIKNLVSQDEKVTAKIELNPNHPVYDGHFPDQSIVPGVIQLQIVSEILSKGIQQNLTLQFASNIKHLAIILPENNSLLDVDIDFKINEDNSYQVKAIIQSEDTVFLKFRGKFTISA